MTPAELPRLVECERGGGDYHGNARSPKRRIVLWIDLQDVERQDALTRDRFADANRATFVRAFVVMGLHWADKATHAKPKGSAP